MKRPLQLAGFVLIDEERKRSPTGRAGGPLVGPVRRAE
jgi:hypothetical protein